MNQPIALSPGMYAAPFVAALDYAAVFVGTDGRIRQANDTMRVRLGSRAGQGLQDMKLVELVAPDAVTAWGAYLNAAVTGTGGNHRLSVALMGDTSTIRIVLRCLRDNDNALLGFLGLPDLDTAQGVAATFPAGNSVAVQDSRDLIDTLTDHEMRWQTALTSAGQGVWDHNMVTGERYVSAIWRQMRGIAPDAQLDASFDAWLCGVHPADRTHVLAHVARHDSGQTDTISYQYRQRHADGHWIWVLSRGHVVERDEGGRVVRVIGTDTDISDIKAAELERALLSDRLSMAIDAADLGVWDYDLDTNTMTWDARLFEIFGLPRRNAPLSRGDWIGFLHPEDSARITAAFYRAIRMQRDFHADFRIVRSDGEIVHLRASAHLTNDAAGRAKFIGISQNVTGDYKRAQEREEARKRLEHESRHDPLTGLPNRRMLELARAGMKGSTATVLHIDLDHFKQVNDTLGHGAGDAVLRHLAEVLNRNCPGDGIVARIGGDEFIMLLSDPRNDDVLETMAGALIEQILEPISYLGGNCRVGASIGIARGNPAVGDDALFVNADLALYEAKKAGRNRVSFYTATLSELAAARRTTLQSLMQGLEKGEIICHYQPQFDATTLRLVGLEALIRWNHPDQGLIMPDNFLPIAEDMGLIAQLDQHVLELAVADLRDWSAMGLDIPRISVNVSARRLGDPGLAALLQRMDLPSGNLSFELLESTFLDANDAVLTSNIDAIKRLGIDIEIDDFGTGHASIISLQRVLPKRLKIDRELIAPIVTSYKQRNLVKTIIEIGHMQDADVIAEGVETPDHVAALRAMGCDNLQGYALSRPLPKEALPGLIEELAKNGGRVIPSDP